MVSRSADPFQSRELADVEVRSRPSSPYRVQPRKMSLVACISRWPSTTRRPWLSTGSVSRALQHRRPRLLRLQEQRIVVVAAEHQQDRGSGCRRCRHRRPCGRCRRGEVAEQLLPVTLAGSARTPQAPRLVPEAGPPVGAESSSSIGTRAVVAADPRLTVHHGGQDWNACWLSSRPAPSPGCLGPWPAPSVARPGQLPAAPRHPMWAYQSSRLPITAYWPWRPDTAPCRLHDARRPLRREPVVRPAISRLAANRFTSHSHGPGRVSSKSLRSNTSWRSGDANTPKFDRWASPQIWTVNPDGRSRPGRRP